MKSILEGIYTNRNWGDRTGYDSSNIPGSPVSIGPAPARITPQNNILAEPIEMDVCHRLHGWQQQLVGLLNRPNEDIYILSQAGSGKTAPVVCHWINNILGISTTQTPNVNTLLKFITEPQTIPQVLWLVPIRNLGVNIEEEMKERFIFIILQILNRAGGIDPTTGNIVFNNQVLNIQTIIKSLGKFGGGKSRDLILGMLALNNNQILSSKIAEFKTILGQLVKDFVEKALVGRIQEGLNTTKMGNSGIKPFVVSIYESARHIIDDSDNLRLIIFDEAQRIQGGDEADDKRAAQIGNSIHKILSHNNGRKAQIVMLSGSTSATSAANVTHFFNMVYNRRFEDRPYQTPENVTNPSDIRVFPMANLTDKFKQLQIIQTSLTYKTGVVFIIFGKNKINQLIDTISPVEAGYVAPGGKLSTSNNNLIYNKQDVKQINNPGNINDINDDRLRRAVSHGIGYLYRPEELTPAREKDTAIVQNLFKEGIIKVLFATDAIKEGINITCKEMYIPTILNPISNEEMETGSLTQLINRAGRKEGSYSSIYTAPEFVGSITRALSKDSKRFGDQAFIFPDSPKSKLVTILKYGVNIPSSAAIDLYRSFRRAFNI